MQSSPDALSCPGPKLAHCGWARRRRGDRIRPSDRVGFLEEESAGAELMDWVSIAVWRLFLGGRCLRDIDTMSMGVSLEVIAPFVDHRFVAGVFGVPGRERCRGVPDKPYDWDLVRPYLGSDDPYRSKRGLLRPLEVWIREWAYQERVLDMLADPDLVRRVGLSPEAVGGVSFALGQPKLRMPWLRVWGLSVLMSWCKRYRVFAPQEGVRGVQSSCS